MSDQDELWKKVLTIQRRVNETVGFNLSLAFRSTPEYQAYTGLCGDAQFARKDNDLSAALVEKVEEYAGKVIALWQQGGW